ncbi:hypothetical protein CP556_14355 [Natrinema sp. CBA1119]|uniref:hypothetical protein n=1 Tax=Natrinema sp. CBA1119 TaxID=1608465 RepID=UPI000BF54851|nr:hypothetical protein [Natrinema sp. CBA1119]PGF17180.1 hypothetical protein CP556_14355 [Natrinema sp. CBA1119]
MTDDTETSDSTRSIDQFATGLEHLQERIEYLETELETKDDRIDDLERDRLEKTTAALRERLEECEQARTRCENAVDAALNKAGTNKDRIEELQARELEKGAHLQTETIDEHELEVQGDRLERITKDDGKAYFRLPDSADPLDGGSVSLAYGDLLPVQQLARMDEDMLRSTANALPTRLAAKLWKARADSSFGDNPWEAGCKGIREYVKASDLKHWIRRQEPGTSEAYAKKLVSRTIDAMLDLSKHRLAVRRRTERKNGLEYTERRLVLPEDAEIPGEPSNSSGSDDDAPETTGVLG